MVANDVMGRSSLAILGGGFAGTTLARRLESRLSADWDMTFVSQENCITYQPLLAEVVGASMLPGHVVATTCCISGKSPSISWIALASPAPRIYL